MPFSPVKQAKLIVAGNHNRTEWIRVGILVDLLAIIERQRKQLRVYRTRGKGSK